MGRGSILRNEFGIFFKNQGQVWVLPRPALIIYKINFKIKLNLNFKINLI